MSTVVAPDVALATDLVEGGWVDICPWDGLDPERGVAARVGDAQVAVFRIPEATGDGALFAVGNRDPGSGANVLSRGIVGSAGPEVYVASPMHKHRFDLRSGRCLDDDTLAVPVFPARRNRGRVQVLAVPLPSAGRARE